MSPSSIHVMTLTELAAHPCVQGEAIGLAYPLQPEFRPVQWADGLALYQYKACPFCVKVPRAMMRQSLSIETLDVKRSETAWGELLAGGGDLKVPCLRVEGGDAQVEWLYKSVHIIGYLEDRFVAGSNVVGAWRAMNYSVKIWPKFELRSTSRNRD